MRIVADLALKSEIKRLDEACDASGSPSAINPAIEAFYAWKCDATPERTAEMRHWMEDNAGYVGGIVAKSNTPSTDPIAKMLEKTVRRSADDFMAPIKQHMATKKALGEKSFPDYLIEGRSGESPLVYVRAGKFPRPETLACNLGVSDDEAREAEAALGQNLGDYLSVRVQARAREQLAYEGLRVRGSTEQSWFVGPKLGISMDGIRALLQRIF